MEHLQENKDNEEYTIYESEDETGEAGKNTSAKAKTYEGFITQSFAQSIVKADGSTIVQIKYKRKITSLILNLDGGQTETKLEDGKNGNKLLKGKYGAKVEVKGLTKEAYGFEKWEPTLPEFFPIKDDSEHIYTAKWKDPIKINIIEGDERLTIRSPVNVVFNAGMTWADIKEKVAENVSLKDEWQDGDYELYDWRAENEDGDEITDETIPEDGMKVYPRSNYAKFEWNQDNPTALVGHAGERPKGKIIIPTKTTEIDSGIFYYCDESTTIDLRGCTELIKINLSNTSITSIDLSPCPKLTNINFYHCDKLENVDLTSCPELTYIWLTCRMTSIDLSPCPELESVGFYMCKKLENVDLSRHTALKRITYDAFTGTINLEVKLPKSINDIANYAFGDAKKGWCKKVLVPNEAIKKLLIRSNYPAGRIELYE